MIIRIGTHTAAGYMPLQLLQITIGNRCITDLYVIPTNASYHLHTIDNKFTRTILEINPQASFSSFSCGLERIPTPEKRNNNIRSTVATIFPNTYISISIPPPSGGTNSNESVPTSTLWCKIACEKLHYKARIFLNNHL